MKAWVMRRFAVPYEINYEEVPESEPVGNEVKVAVKAAGINYGETLVLHNGHQSRPTLPYIFGIEGSGVVMACGPQAKRFKPGDEVGMLRFNMGGGCCAETVTLEEKYVLAKPAGFSFEQMAAFPGNYGTSYNALCSRGRIRAGEVLVVHGAAGGVGLAAIQIGKAFGATVIAVVGSDGKAGHVKAAGADHVVNYNAGPLREAILELTGGRGADIHYDPVGGDTFNTCMRSIAPGGRILVVGFIGGQPYATAATNIILVKMISVIGVEYGVFQRNFPEEAAREREEMKALAEKNLLKPVISKIFPITQFHDALSHVADRNVVGKTVLDISLHRGT